MNLCSSHCSGIDDDNSIILQNYHIIPFPQCALRRVLSCASLKKKIIDQSSSKIQFWVNLKHFLIICNNELWKLWYTSNWYISKVYCISALIPTHISSLLLSFYSRGSTWHLALMTAQTDEVISHLGHNNLHR